MKFRALWVAAIFLTLLSPSVSFAQVSQGPEFQKGISELFEGRFEEAAAILNRVAKKQPDNADVLFHLGNARLGKQSFKEATSAYQRALKDPRFGFIGRVYIARARRMASEPNGCLEIILHLDGVAKTSPYATIYEKERDLCAQSLASESLTAYQKGNTAMARAWMDKSFELRRSADQLILDGLILEKENNLDRARSRWKEALELTPEASTAELAQSLLTKQRQTRWTLVLEVAGGYDSNVFRTSTSNNPVSAMEVQFGVGAGFRYFSKPSLDLNVRYNAYWDEIVSRTEFRSLNHAFYNSIQYKPQAIEITFGQRVTHQSQHFSDYLVSLGLELEILWKSDIWEVAGEWNVYRQISLEAGYEYLSGLVQQRTLSLTRRWLGRRMSIGIRSFDTDAGDIYISSFRLPYRSTSWGPYVEYSADVGLKWGWLGRVSYLKRDFAETALPSGIARTDQTLSLDTRVVRELGARESVFLNFGISRNISSLGLYGLFDQYYFKINGLLGFRWGWI